MHQLPFDDHGLVPGHLRQVHQPGSVGELKGEKRVVHGDVIGHHREPALGVGVRGTIVRFIVLFAAEHLDLGNGMHGEPFGDDDVGAGHVLSRQRHGVGFLVQLLEQHAESRRLEEHALS